MYEKVNYKKINKLEEEIKEKYGLYSVIVVDKPLQRHSTLKAVPEKLHKIVNAVFPNMLVLDHERYAYEKGKHVFYTEPYNYIKIQRIDTKMAERFGVDLIPLKRSLHDCGTYPYKIIVNNPGDLEEQDLSIGFEDEEKWS